MKAEILMKKRKGITPVLSIVLLVLILVGLIGGVYLFISGSQEEAQESAQESVSKTIQSATSKLVIETVWDNGGKIGVQIRNVGTSTYTTSDFSTASAFVDGSPRTIEGLTSDLPEDETTTFNVTGPYVQGGTLKITFAKGGSLTKVLP